MGIQLSVAAVDHGLRPESAAEVHQVGEWVQAELGLPFYALHLSLPREGASLQARAREARYAALRSLATSLGAQRIAVGHSQDDQAETVLERLLRGNGLLSLSAIDPGREDGVIRPLIDCRRGELRSYARRWRLPVLEDPSNRDPRFKRVRIRHELLPMLSAENPNLVPHLANLAEEARALRTLLDTQARALVDPTLEGREHRAACLPVKLLKSAAPPLQSEGLRRWIEATTGQRPGRAQLEAAADLLQRGAGEVWLRAGWSLWRVSDELHLEQNPSPSSEIVHRRQK